MPLLVSPIDGKSPMQQIVRDGIEIDRCPVSGGIWLDAGELEKLLGRLAQAANEDRYEYANYRQAHPQAPAHYAPPPPHYHGKPYKYDDDYDDYYKRKYGKKSSMKRLFDIFD
jgi:uncharacterized protein